MGCSGVDRGWSGVDRDATGWSEIDGDAAAGSSGGVEA